VRERLQKLIARAGVCSRREAETLIREGRVTINGRVAAIGDQADPAQDAVKVDGKRLKAPQRLRYLVLFKPDGFVTTTADPEGRPTVLDLLGGRVAERVFPVGRLDFHSEGLVILTNDGEFALRLAHPRYGVLREYSVKVRGVPDEGDRARLRSGAVVEGARVVPHALEMMRTTSSGLNSWWRVVVGEGKTHEVRELFQRVGHPVQRLIRTALGELRLPALGAGQWRDLTPDEIELLRGGAARAGRHADARTTGSGVHPQAGRVRAGKADRGSGARARDQRHRQAGLKREPARTIAKGGGRHQGGAPELAPLPRRRRVRAAQGARRAPRG
jgi:23S rRNA pseudouridine2605 synthase